MMKLDLDRQESGRSDLAIRGTLKLGLPDGRPDEAKVDGILVVQNLESRVLLNGSLQAEGQAECGNCLEEFSVRWDVPVEVLIGCAVPWNCFGLRVSSLISPTFGVTLSSMWVPLLRIALPNRS